MLTKVRCLFIAVLIVTIHTLIFWWIIFNLKMSWVIIFRAVFETNFMYFLKCFMTTVRQPPIHNQISHICNIVIVKSFYLLESYWSIGLISFSSVVCVLCVHAVTMNYNSCVSYAYFPIISLNFVYLMSCGITNMIILWHFCTLSETASFSGISFDPFIIV